MFSPGHQSEQTTLSQMSTQSRAGFIGLFLDEICFKSDLRTIVYRCERGTIWPAAIRFPKWCFTRPRVTQMTSNRYLETIWVVIPSYLESLIDCQAARSWAQIWSTSTFLHLVLVSNVSETQLSFPLPSIPIINIFHHQVDPTLDTQTKPQMRGEVSWDSGWIVNWN